MSVNSSNNERFTVYLPSDSNITTRPNNMPWDYVVDLSVPIVTPYESEWKVAVTRAVVPGMRDASTDHRTSLTEAYFMLVDTSSGDSDEGDLDLFFLTQYNFHTRADLIQHLNNELVPRMTKHMHTSQRQCIRFTWDAKERCVVMRLNASHFPSKYTLQVCMSKPLASVLGIEVAESPVTQPIQVPWYKRNAYPWLTPVPVQSASTTTTLLVWSVQGAQKVVTGKQMTAYLGDAALTSSNRPPLVYVCSDIVQPTEIDGKPVPLLAVIPLLVYRTAHPHFLNQQ